MTRSSLVGGFGPTFVVEIKQLDRALDEIARLRNGLEKSAAVIEAGEKDRRALVARVCELERQLAGGPFVPGPSSLLPSV